MKIHTSRALFLAVSLTASASAFRDQSQKKQKGRRLQDKDTEADQVCTIDHDAAKSVGEINVKLETYPTEGSGLFKIILKDAPFASAENPVETFGWCIDYDRYIDKGDWSMDVFSSYDPDIHGNAVDYPEYYPNLAFLINNVNVGDKWPASDSCAGMEAITWNELQGAAWMVIDEKSGEGEWWEEERINCVSEEIAAYARANGNDYKLDCTDENEQVPLVMVTDDETGNPTHQTIISETNVHTIPGFCKCEDVPDTRSPPPDLAPPKGPGSSSGDPHFKTWTGEKYDYHGECDLVLVDHPSFEAKDGSKGLQVHIRTTRVKYFSFIESVAIQIGNDVLEFANDVTNFMINGKPAGENKKHHKTMLGGFVVRRDPKALSIRLADGTGPHQKLGAAKIDLIHRKNGFPSVIVNGGATDIFKGSLGLLGDWESGKKLARDGSTEMIVNGVQDSVGATAFALEWQVRDSTLFQEARFPQFPQVCTPPAKMTPGAGLGSSHFKKEAEEACAHWTEDIEDCLFDVIATKDIMVAQEGHFLKSE